MNDDTTMRLVHDRTVTRPAGLTAAEHVMYRHLTRRLSVQQAVDVATGVALHGCTVQQAAILRLVMRFEEKASGVAA